MLDSIAESIGKIIDGFGLIFSGLIGIGYWLFALLIAAALIRWLVVEPTKFLRFLVATAAAITIIFSIPILSIFVPGLGVDRLHKGVVFGLQVFCFYLAYKAAILIVGKDDDSSDSDRST